MSWSPRSSYTAKADGFLRAFSRCSFQSQILKSFFFFFWLNFPCLCTFLVSGRFADAVDSCGATNSSCCSVELQPVACMEYVTGDVDYVSRTLEVRHGVQPLTAFPDSLTNAQMFTALQCDRAEAVAFFIYFESVLVCSQTEDPAMERPYTFKDFLLRPRRSVFSVLFCLFWFFWILFNTKYGQSTKMFGLHPQTSS